MISPDRSSDLGIVLQVALAGFGVAFFAMYKAMPRHAPYTGRQRNWWIGVISFAALFAFNLFAAYNAWGTAYDVSGDKKITALLSFILNPMLLLLLNVIFFFYYLQIQKSINEWVATKSQAFQDNYKWIKTSFQITWTIYVFIYVIIPIIKKVDFAGAKYKYEKLE